MVDTGQFFLLLSVIFVVLLVFASLILYAVILIMWMTGYFDRRGEPLPTWALWWLAAIVAHDQLMKLAELLQGKLVP